MNFMYTDEAIKAVATEFFNDQCIVNLESKGVSYDAMYAAYCLYARDKGMLRLSSTAFAIWLRKHFTHVPPPNQCKRKWVGIDLRVMPW